MNNTEMLRIVDSMHRDKNIPKETIFEGIEAALLLAARKHFEDESTDIQISINRDTGEILARRGETSIDPAVLGRIAAQSAKQVMIQKLREAECNVVFDDFASMKGDLVHGSVTRIEGGSALVNLGRVEAILPRSEMIPGESHHVGQRIKAVVLDVRKMGSRVRIVLSRTHPEFVRRLFEQEIPEIGDGTISIKAVSREAGYRTKIAVSSIDSKVDPVGACVGVRGSRIKNIVEELNSERIDITRWNDSLEVMIPNALQPAQIQEVFLYPRLGRAIVLVREDQLSLAIGRRGQNVRLASKLVGWDIEIMTADELQEGIERAIGWFGSLPHVDETIVERFLEEGFLSYDDLTFLEPAQLAELTGMTEEQADEVIMLAEELAETVEVEERSRPAETQPAQPQPTAADILPGGDDADQQEPEKTATLESLFGSDTPAEATPEEATQTEPPSEPAENSEPSPGNE